MSPQKSLKSSRFRVSDHALARYMERVMGIDIQGIKDEIAGEKDKRVIKALGGSGVFPKTDCEGNEFRLKVIKNTVVTILT